MAALALDTHNGAELSLVFYAGKKFRRSSMATHYQLTLGPQQVLLIVLTASRRA